MRTVALLAAAFLPSVALAHGFGQKIDLPIPLYLYLFGGAGIVALSFISLGLGLDRLTQYAARYRTLNLSQFRWFQFASHRYFVAFIKAGFVGFFLLLIAAGFFGNQDPVRNILPTTIWILFGVGITFISALLGNVWAVINPLKTIAEYAERVFSSEKNDRIEWPLWLGVWPAVIGFFVYRWIENVSTSAGSPSVLATYLVIYTLITLLGVAVVGKETWFRYADPFSIFFGFLSRFSITERRLSAAGAEVHIRPPGVGLLHGNVPTLSETCFILLMLSTVAADGVLSTPFFEGLMVSGLGYDIPWNVSKTIGLLGLFAGFVVTYAAFSYLTRLIIPAIKNTATVACTFIVSLLPISIAYEFAHFVSLLAIDGQRILYLVSDPLGRGWNLFGPAGYEINYAILDLKLLWHFQVGLIIIGHVIAVYISHAIAMRYLKDSRDALISQHPMLILMIFYSMLSLWIMGQPIVAG